jgi:hypothetical protein
LPLPGRRVFLLLTFPVEGVPGSVMKDRCLSDSMHSARKKRI